MTITSSYFFLFLIVGLIIYYLPFLKKGQKYILLVASIFFYFTNLNTDWWKIVFVLLYIWGFCYIGTLFISKTKGKLKKFLLTICLLGVSFSLFLFKYAYNLVSAFRDLFSISAEFNFLNFAAIMGISYFALSGISYILDVYWENIPVCKNPCTVALFLIYFPQMISGPITQMGQMQAQFEKEHVVDVEKMKRGIRRMLIGYVQKLVISARFGQVVAYWSVNRDSFSGITNVLAILCYAIQLYTDFSGCMDIIMGVSELFGIDLPENFEAPFLSRSVKEFWVRWHMTLGNFSKTYIMYPLQMSKPIVKLGKTLKKKVSKKAAKRIPMFLAMFVVWMFIGVWHGCTPPFFMGAGFVPFFYIILADLLEPLNNKLNALFHVNQESKVVIELQRIRLNLFMCLTWVFLCAGTATNGFKVIGHSFAHPFAGTAASFMGMVSSVSVLDLVLMIAGLLYLGFIDHLRYKKVDCRDWLDGVKRWLYIPVVYVEVLLLFFYANVGSSAFIYFDF